MIKMEITFVDDAPKEVDAVRRVLETTQYFQPHVFAHYDAVKEDAIRDSDLFVLDVLMLERDPKPFAAFIQELHRRHKPFIAFTRLIDEQKVKSVPGEPELRKLVFEHGGLGVVSKGPDVSQQGQLKHRDLQMELLERIMAFYWGWFAAASLRNNASFLRPPAN